MWQKNNGTVNTETCLTSPHLSLVPQAPPSGSLQPLGSRRKGKPRSNRHKIPLLATPVRTEKTREAEVWRKEGPPLPARGFWEAPGPPGLEALRISIQERSFQTSRTWINRFPKDLCKLFFLLTSPPELKTFKVIPTPQPLASLFPAAGFPRKHWENSVP